MKYQSISPNTFRENYLHGIARRQFILVYSVSLPVSQAVRATGLAIHWATIRFVRVKSVPFIHRPILPASSEFLQFVSCSR